MEKQTVNAKLFVASFKYQKHTSELWTVDQQCEISLYSPVWNAKYIKQLKQVCR
jgi:hypothetical protein